MRKIIFVDIDGVLNNATWAAEMYEQNINVFGEDKLEERAIKLLKDIVEATGAEVVISSSWRKIPEMLNTLKRQLAAHDIKVKGITPSIERAGIQRGDEIAEWLSRNQDVTHFAILDDDSDMRGVEDHFVKTTFAHGLQQEHVDKVIDLLNRP